MTEDIRRRRSYNHQQTHQHHRELTPKAGMQSTGKGDLRATTYRKPLRFAARIFDRSPLIVEYTPYAAETPAAARMEFVAVPMLSVRYRVERGGRLRVGSVFSRVRV